MTGAVSTAGAEEPGEDADLESTYLRYENGELSFLADDERNRIPDYSWAGYRLREEPIPDVPTVKKVGPVDGDNTEHLQAAIDEVGSRPKGEGPPSRGPPQREIRGAVELEPGEYPIEGTLKLNHTGVILRGAGDGSDPEEDTIIRPVDYDWGPYGGAGIRVGAADTTWENQTDTEVEITTDFVQVGDRSFEVEDASPFEVGQNVIVYHPCTEEWLDAIDHGGTDDEPGWEADEEPIYYNRHVRAIDGNEITIDAPVYNHLDRDLATASLYPADRSGLVREVGVEDLRVEIEAEGNRTENYSNVGNGIVFDGAEDAWVTGSTVRNWQRSGISAYASTRVTVRDCRAIDPFSPVDAALRYNFNAEHRAQLLLFEDCYANNGRHPYVVNGTAWASGIVFYDVFAEDSAAASEGHRRWSQGLLYDTYVNRGNYGEDGSPGIMLGNRGSYGTAHGWGAVHSTVWNADLRHSNADGVLVEKPPTAQNYAVGVRGPLWYPGPFEKPQGHVEGHEQAGKYPKSLYEVQLEQREVLDGPDLAARLEVDLERRDADAIVGLEITIRNRGTKESNPTEAAARNATDDEEIVRFSLPKLSSGEAKSFTYEWDISHLDAGIYDVAAVADPDDLVNEAGAIPNRHSVRFAYGADLAVDLEASPLPEDRDVFRLESSITNEGTVPSEPTRLELRNLTDDEAIVRLELPEVASEETKTLTYEWDASHLEEEDVYEVAAIADPDGTVDEIHETNNRDSATLPVNLTVVRAEASASSVYGSFTPDNAIDGTVFSSFWHSEFQGPPQWLEIELDRSVELGGVVVWDRGDPFTLTDFDVSTVGRSDSLTVQREIRDNPDHEIHVEFDDPVSADRIRLTIYEILLDGEPREAFEISNVELFDPDGETIYFERNL